MGVCKKCLLNDNLPSVRIDNDGLCNYCNAAASLEARRHWNTADGEFAAMLEKFGDRRYQVIMAYSGGKDSTYTLKLIREKYHASILAVTFNNGFLSESSLRNISRVTDYLGTDSLIVKYPANKLVDAFQYVEDGKPFPRTSLERASPICNLCIMLIKNMIYYEAILRNIPIICFGWTPGQVETAKPLLKLNYRMVSKMFDNTRNAIAGKFGNAYDKYFLDVEFMKENEDRVPYLYYPFVNNAYSESKILEEIGEIGWELPENTDGNSSNCLLNSYANQSHVERFGYHPYALEISSMVRNGYMTREEGMKKLENVKNDSSFELIKARFQDTGK
jgi:tRNA(Ile)-lysidine synthase TilS/MesJ